MSKRGISSTLKNLKFMQRAAQREDKIKNQEEDKPDGNFFSPGTIRKCVVIMEGDPHPGSSTGRMSFQSFNPSVDKLNEAAGDVCQPESVDVCAPSSATPSGRTSSRENGSSMDGAECSKTDRNGYLKRKQSEFYLNLKIEVYYRRVKLANIHQLIAARAPLRDQNMTG